jgi:hypothetical protein
MKHPISVSIKPAAAHRTGTTASLTSDVLDCRLDSAFVSGPIAHPELEQLTVFQEELILVAPKSVRSLNALGREIQMIAFRMDCSYRQRLDSFFARRGLANFSISSVPPAAR